MVVVGGQERIRICGERVSEFIGREADAVVVGLNRNWGQLAAGSPVSRRVQYPTH